MSKTGKILLGISAVVIAILMAVMLFVSNLLSLVSAFKPDGYISAVNTYDVMRTKIYQSVKTIDDKYMDMVGKQISDERSILIKKNTYEVTVQDPETGKERKEKRCDIKVKRIINHIDYSCLIAYLMYEGGLDEKTGEIDENKALEFLKSISKVEITEIKEKKYEIQNAFLTQDEIADRYFKKDTEKKRFIASCHAYEIFFGVSVKNISSVTNDDAEDNPMPDDPYDPSYQDMPLYLQYSGSWSSMAYGNGTISSKGCAPTCLAMVLSYMRQEQILPSDIVAWTGNRYYVNGAGSSWDIFPAVASNWGISCKSLGHSQSNMLAALSAGKPVIASMGPGEFTKGGHFIVLTGLTSDGKITVNDPNDSAKKNHKGRSFDVSLIMRESKCFWSFG